MPTCMSYRFWSIAMANYVTGTPKPYKTPLQCYQQFAESKPRSFFGALLRRQVFKNMLKNMLDQKAVPKGLRNKEAERGHTSSKIPLILYIPLENKIGDKVKGDLCLFMVKNDNKTTVKESI